MPRPRTFEEADVIARAREAFAETGFAGTSLDTLLEATGLARQSLYNAFGGKKELFMRAFLSDAAEAVDAVESIRHGSDSPVAGIRAQLVKVAVEHGSAQTPRPCPPRPPARPTPPPTRTRWGRSPARSSRGCPRSAGRACRVRRSSTSGSPAWRPSRSPTSAASTWAPATATGPDAHDLTAPVIGRHGGDRTPAAGLPTGPTSPMPRGTPAVSASGDAITAASDRGLPRELVRNP